MAPGENEGAHSLGIGSGGFECDEDRLAVHLSGGEKQKLALAAVLAMDPEILILDESTSMLDPSGRREFIDALLQIRTNNPFTLIYITHHLEEVLNADRWVLFSGGQIAAVGRPEELWQKKGLLEACGLELPFLQRLALELRKRGVMVTDPENLESWRSLICESN